MAPSFVSSPNFFNLSPNNCYPRFDPNTSHAMSARRKPLTESKSYHEPVPTGTATMSSATDTDTHKTSSNTRSPLLPTRLELLLLSIYPITLFLGSFFSILSPVTRNLPYNPATQSHPPDLAPSYFAQKRNIFNVYFVKKGWLWTTVSLFFFIFTHPSFGPPLRPMVTPRRVRAALRYAMATAWWTLVTQWCFGPPLIDRSFRLTGGRCETPVAATNSASGTAFAPPQAKDYLTATACRAVGGKWRGGHDVSGHVFLLILGSALLWFEILPSLLRAEGLRDGRRIRMSDGKVRTAAAEAQRETHDVSKAAEALVGGEEKAAGLATKVGLGIAALMWWMLLMTAAFFHTWFEKFTGLLVACAGVWTVYFLPRNVPALRRVVGMPGV